MGSNQVGIVVIGRNEGGRLVTCLKSVMRYTTHVIYVDSGSTDNSVEAASQLGARVIILDKRRPFTAARARNEGFHALMGFWQDLRLVQFVDGDCEMNNKWLPTATKFMAEHPDVAVVCGRRRERYPSASAYNRLCDIEWDTPVGEASSCGGDSLIQIEAFKSVGGFRAELVAGEEPELCLRLREKGWKVWRLEVEMTIHDAAMTRFSQWWLRSVRSGYGMTEVTRLHWHSPMALWKKELARAIFWGLLLPFIIGIGVFVNPIAFLALLIYPIQVIRLHASRGWTYAFFVTLGKFAELQGIFRFYMRHIGQRSTQLIEYK
jgi:GT2 family glycosyltransferase